MENIFDNQDFIDRLREGDLKAFKTLFSSYVYSALYFYSLSIVKEEEAAKDIVTDAFCKFWKQKADMKNGPHMKGFLFLTARHGSLDHLRKAKRTAAVRKELQYLAVESVDELERRLLEADVLERIFRMAEDLPEKCRQVFDLLFREGLGIKEVADRLGISLSTVYGHRSKLKKTYASFLRNSKSFKISP